MGYCSGIPDQVPDRLMELKRAPSYKAIAIAILKNDSSLKSLGFEPKKSEYYHFLKKIEIASRPNQVTQLTLNFNQKYV